MPRLPTANDLGRVPLRPATGTSSPDLSAPYRAAQQLGDQVTQIAGSVADDQNRLELGKAQTAWLQGQSDTHAGFEKDNDYSTMQERYGQQMQKVTENASSGISSGRLRQEFDSWANNQNIRGGEKIRTLAWGKEKDASIAGLNLSLDSSRSTYLTSSDAESRQQILDATNNMIQGAAEKGYIDKTQAQQLGQHWITNTATGSLKMMQPDQRIAALQNPSGIVSFLPPDQRQAMVKEASYESLNARLGQQQLQIQTGDSGMNSLSVPDDSLLNAVFQQESGNRHLNPDGSIVTSKAGAQGAGQIMPQTGRAPGFGVKPLQDDSEQENRRLTSDYLGAMLKRYNGNQILALAAYNAGAGKVDDWIKQIGDPRQGTVTNEQFAASIPFNETRNYVYSVSANAQRMGNVNSIIESPEFKNLDGQQQAQVASRTIQIQDQIDSAYRVNIHQRLTDDSARAQSGAVIENPVTEAEFVRSIPVSSTPGEREQYYQQWNRYKDTLALQPVNNFVMQNSASAGLAAVQAMKPADNSPDFQFKSQQYAQALQNYQRTVNARESDPGGWMVQNIPEIRQAFDAYSNNPDLMGDYVKSVIIQKQRLGIKDQAVLPNTQANQLSQALINSPAQQKASILDAIHKGTGGGAAYMATMRQIVPKAPSIAVAGVLMDKSSTITAESNLISPDIKVSPSDAATTILQGASARKGADGAKGMQMPKDSEMRNGFSDEVGNAFAGDTDGAETAYQAAQDYYAGVMQGKGDLSGQFDSSTWKQAVRVATGGIYDYNGMGNVLLPWGMPSQQFDSQVNQAWQSQVVDAGVKAPPGKYGLQSYGDSQYLVKLGAGYLTKGDGTPVIIDLRQSRQRFVGGIPQ